jgi:23S rRNA pseudouridine955/2504/2580 synthase
MFLHARALGFEHPVGGERVVLQAALPADCAALLG